MKAAMTTIERRDVVLGVNSGIKFEGFFVVLSSER
jgi:hypothetical protein